MTRARAEIVVELPAIRHNVRVLREHTGTPVMTVVKADGYGHGLLPAARAAREGGAAWLGVATLDEALALRAGGDTGRVLIRPSGTEPMVRVMVEAASQDRAQTVAERLAGVVRSALG